MSDARILLVMRNHDALIEMGEAILELLQGQTGLGVSGQFGFDLFA